MPMTMSVRSVVGTAALLALAAMAAGAAHKYGKPKTVVHVVTLTYNEGTSEDEKKAVLRLYAEVESATEVARQLKVSDRTVRSLVRKSRDEVTDLKKASKKDRLFDLVESGMSASAAGRQLGIAERTARTWARKMRSEE